MKFTPATIDDLPQIAQWIESDPDHLDKMSAYWWLTGNDCVFAGCVQDEFGPVLYVRMDREGSLVRLHTQFAPEDQVSKKQVVQVLLKGFPTIADEMRRQKAEGIVFESVSAPLIEFMCKFGFKHSTGNDYVLMFGEV